MDKPQFPCERCGAMLEYAPGTGTLVCPHCGQSNPVPRSGEPVAELDFAAALAKLEAAQETYEVQTVCCAACGAETTLPPNVTAGRCPFCGGAVVLAARSHKAIKPKALLPFHVARPQALAAFRGWLGSLWFAPSELKRVAREEEALRGVYVPYWTYDCRTTSRYTGQRGDDYWETQHYTVRVNGRTEHRTRQVRKTRWRFASGTVHNEFDDVLVLASDSLPRRYAEKLEPWDLHALVPYRDEYLAGLGAESYHLDLRQGFAVAQRVMEVTIRRTICRDIGGDHQRIHSVDTRYADTTFKHILLPIWISAYRHRGRVFRFLVNARTGEVQGERPWSTWKIALAVLLALLLAALIALLFVQAQGR